MHVQFKSIATLSLMAISFIGCSKWTAGMELALHITGTVVSTTDQSSATPVASNSEFTMCTYTTYTCSSNYEIRLDCANIDTDVNGDFESWVNVNSTYSNKSKGCYSKESHFNDVYVVMSPGHMLKSEDMYYYESHIETLRPQTSDRDTLSVFLQDDMAQRGFTYIAQESLKDELICAQADSTSSRGYGETWKECSIDIASNFYLMDYGVALKPSMTIKVEDVQ
jgi:hypothetical protein